MLIAEKTINREMTATEALALIETIIQHQISLALQHSKLRNGKKRFPDITATNWKLVDPIDLCNKLLQTFDEVSSSDSTLNKVKEVAFPDRITHESVRKLMIDLETIAKIEGADYTFAAIFSDAEMSVIIKRWLQRIKQSRIPGKDAFEEDLRQLNPHNIEQFIVHLTEVTENAKNAKKDARRFSGETSGYIGNRSISRDRQYDRSRDKRRNNSRDSRSGQQKDYGTSFPDMNLVVLTTQIPEEHLNSTMQINANINNRKNT